MHALRFSCALCKQLLAHHRSQVKNGRRRHEVTLKCILGMLWLMMLHRRPELLDLEMSGAHLQPYLILLGIKGPDAAFSSLPMPLARVLG